MFVATVLLAVGPPLLGDGVLAGTDVVRRYQPWSALDGQVETLLPVGDTVDGQLSSLISNRERLARGDVPLWDSSVGGGYETLAVPTQSALHPIGWVYLLAPLPIGIAWAGALTAFVAGGFTTLFLRRLRVGLPSAIAGGLIYAFNGFQVVWLHWPHPIVGASVPVAFWAVERCRQERTAASVIPVALALFCLIVAGFPAVVVHALYALVVYVVVTVLADVLDERKGGGAALRSTLLRSTNGLVLAAAGAALGVGLAMAQIIPFLGLLDRIDLSYRAASHLSGLPGKTIATAAFPFAFGSPNEGRYFGPANPMEALAFVGVLSLPLVLLALGRSRGSLRPGARSAFIALTLLTTAVIFGPLVIVADVLPGWQGSFVGRLRGVWAFGVACSAAIGLDAITSSIPAVSQRRKASALAVSAAILLVGASLLWRTASLEADDVGTQRSIALGLAVFAAGAVLVMGPWVRLRTFGMIALIALQILSFAWEFWPRVGNDDFYPETAAHHYLKAQQDDQRTVFDEYHFYPGTHQAYGIRSLTGHTFIGDEWKDYFVAIQPDAFRFSPTFPVLTMRSEQRIFDPLLDRASVRFAAFGIDAAVVGNRPDVSKEVEFAPTNGGVEASVPFAGIRGLIVRPSSPVEGVGVIEVTVVSEAGELLSLRRFRGGVLPEAFELPIAEFDGDVVLRITAPGGLPESPLRVTVRPIEALDDGLTLVFAQDAAIYERDGAMPFVRFADDTQVVDDRPWSEQLAALPPTTALVESPEYGGLAGSGVVTAVDDEDSDRLVVDVEVAATSLLVVTAGLTDVWRAEIDGKATDLVPVDHAMTGVVVPPGAERIRLWYEPPNARLGIATSSATLLILVSIGIGSVIARRRQRWAERLPPGDRSHRAKPPATSLEAEERT
jgi:hypothetical protein